ncbi:MAG: DUF1501 domain-containing protein [Planctomycetota bacterium]|jgi:hypothetical protein|nr:DUF1501 domain-containing protein [Planctomycetota bacterium]
MSNQSRREFLMGLGAGLGSVAFSDLLAQGAPSLHRGDPLAPKPPQLPAKAKSCIFLFMEGGPSHIDTFDPKPKLKELHLQTFKSTDPQGSAMSRGNRFYVGSPYASRKVGESGIDMCEYFRHLPAVADDLCVYRGCQADSVNHPTALYQMNTGNQFGGDPAIGAWMTYGLGSLNRNLPAYIVLNELAYPQGGAGNWSNGFLSPVYQGTPLRPVGPPILHMNPPDWVDRKHQRRNLDALHELNEAHRAKHPGHDDLAARMESYELAFRMQTEVPGVVDLDGESPDTLAMYGVGEEGVDSFARRCLLARRMVEKGVRFVQIFSGGWDSHDYIERSHKARIASIDKPMTALIKDLKRRGMLDETLVVWCGEFGRSPDNTYRGGGIALGRDHNKDAMSVLLAGGGVKAGHVIGATDEIGKSAVEVVHPIKDFHVTLLRLLGLDDNKLTYFHGGRFKQLSQTGGEVIEELIA